MEISDYNDVKFDDFKLLIFVALSSCSCSYETFMNRVFEVITPFKEKIDFQVEDALGFKGYKYDIIKPSIVIEWKEEGLKDPLIFDKISDLKRFIAKVNENETIIAKEGN